MSNTVYTRLNINRDLHRQMRVMSFRRGLKLYEAYNEALTLYVNTVKKDDLMMKERILKELDDFHEWQIEHTSHHVKLGVESYYFKVRNLIESELT